MEPLLRLLGEWCSVGGPGEIFCYVHPQEFSAADSLHSRAVDGQWGVVNRVPPEVHHNLLCLPHIEGQVVCTTPFNQLCHFLSVWCFIIVADEAYHSCVIGKLDDVVGAELGSAVVGQQREGWTTDVKWAILMMSLLPFWALNVVVPLVTMQGKKALGFH